MARLVAAVLVGVLLCAAPALALSASSPALPPLPALAPTTPLGAAAGDSQTPPLPTAVVVPDQTKVVSAPAVSDLLTCRQAVQVDLVGWGGNPVQHRDERSDFVRHWTVTEDRLTWVPRLAMVQERLSGALGLLPTTHAVLRQVGLDPVHRPVSQTYDVATHLVWGQDLVHWTKVKETVDLTLPAGLPLVALGQGQQVKMCDPNVALLSALPAQDHTGYHYWSLTHRHDEWITHFVSDDVHLATPEELRTLPQTDSWARCACPFGDQLDAAAQALGLHVTGTGVDAGPANDATAAPAVAPANVGAANAVPVGRAASGLGLAALLGAAGTVALALRRRP